MNLNLDRMSVEEAGPNPEKLAREVLRQLGPVETALPIEQIAYALDIEDIRYEALSSFEGAVLFEPEKGYGQILVNSASNQLRQRFTIAHELGHFLNTWHIPNDSSGFMCEKASIGESKTALTSGSSRYQRQEIEANRFAIELLSPRSIVERMSKDDPSFGDILNIAKTLELSKSAAARRYVELHPARLAIVFTHAGQVLFSVASQDCPKLFLRKGDHLLSKRTGESGSIIMHEIDIAVGQGSRFPKSLNGHAETLYQQDNYAMTLIDFGPGDEEETDPEENNDDRWA